MKQTSSLRVLDWDPESQESHDRSSLSCCSCVLKSGMFWSADLRALSALTSLTVSWVYAVSVKQKHPSFSRWASVRFDCSGLEALHVVETDTFVLTASLHEGFCYAGMESTLIEECKNSWPEIEYALFTWSWLRIFSHFDIAPFDFYIQINKCNVTYNYIF